MTDMTIDMHDICGRKGDGQAMIRALMPRPSDGRVVTPEWVKTPIIAGLAAFADVAPGLAEVHVRVGSGWSASWTISVPDDGPVALADLLDSPPEIGGGGGGGGGVGAARGRRASVRPYPPAWRPRDVAGRPGRPVGRRFQLRSLDEAEQVGPESSVTAVTSVTDPPIVTAVTAVTDKSGPIRCSVCGLGPLDAEDAELGRHVMCGGS